MKLYVKVLLFLSLMLTLVSCTENTILEDESSELQIKVENEESDFENTIEEKFLINEIDSSNGVLYLGMDFTNAMKWFDSNGINYDVESSASNSEDLSMVYYTLLSDAISISTNSSGFDGKNVTHIYVKNDFSTSLGLKKGDGVEKMIQLYGREYTSEIVNNIEIFKYQMKNSVLTLSFFEDVLLGWSISVLEE